MLTQNDIQTARSMVNIDQICWHEFAADPYLTTQVEDSDIAVPKPIHNSGWGMEWKRDTIVLEQGEPATSRRYHNLLEEYEDIEKIKMPELTMDPQEYELVRPQAGIIFDGIIPFRMEEMNLQLGLWTPSIPG